MTVTVEWFDDEHIISLTRLIGNWTWDEVWAAYRQAQQMVHDEGIEYRVDTIIDLTFSTQIPPLGSLMQTKRLADLNNPTRGMMVFVKPNRIMRALAKTFWLFLPESAEKFPFEFAETIAEAHAILTRHRDEWA